MTDSEKSTNYEAHALFIPTEAMLLLFSNVHLVSLALFDMSSTFVCCLSKFKRNFYRESLLLIFLFMNLIVLRNSVIVYSTAVKGKTPEKFTAARKRIRFALLQAPTIVSLHTNISASSLIKMLRRFGICSICFNNKLHR